MTAAAENLLHNEVLALTDGRLQASATSEAAGDDSFRGEVGILRQAYRASRKPPLGGPLKTFSVVAIVCFAAAYLIWGCFQHAFLRSGVGIERRAAAAASLESSSCGGWEVEAQAEERVASNTKRKAVEEQQLGARQAQEEGELRIKRDIYLAAKSARYAAGWGVRSMPSIWSRKAISLFKKLKDVATQCFSLLPVLHPDQAVDMVTVLAKVAAVELCALALVPDAVQQERAVAGAAYVQLLEVVLTGDAFSAAVVKRKGRGHLECLQRLLVKMHGQAPKTDKMSASMYKSHFLNMWYLSNFSCHQVAVHMDLLVSSTSSRGCNPRHVQTVLSVFGAVFQRRKQQILADLTMSFWFCHCQKTVAPFMLYSREEYQNSRQENSKTRTELLKEIEDAVLIAGGSPQPVETEDTQEAAMAMEAALRSREAATQVTAAWHPRASEPDLHRELLQQLQQRPCVPEGPVPRQRLPPTHAGLRVPRHRGPVVHPLVQQLVQPLQQQVMQPILLSIAPAVSSQPVLVAAPPQPPHPPVFNITSVGPPQTPAVVHMPLQTQSQATALHMPPAPLQASYAQSTLVQQVPPMQPTLIQHPLMQPPPHVVQFPVPGAGHPAAFTSVEKAQWGTHQAHGHPYAFAVSAYPPSANPQPDVHYWMAAEQTLQPVLVEGLPLESYPHYPPGYGGDYYDPYGMGEQEGGVDPYAETNGVSSSTQDDSEATR